MTTTLPVAPRCAELPATALPRYRPLSYEALLGPAAWARLPAVVRSRFACHEARWAGEMTLHASLLGRCAVQLCRLVGSPLPPASDEPVCATVHVEPDEATGGSRWVRRYHYPHRTVEIRSVKSVDSEGRMIERLAMGLRMELELRADADSLHFISTGYHLEIPLCWPLPCALRLPFPSWWLPGCTHVVHRDLGDGSFRFTMSIGHAWLGELFHHDGVFRSTGGRS
jgi:uncharacterized protein DUF4166